MYLASMIAIALTMLTPVAVGHVRARYHRARILRARW